MLRPLTAVIGPGRLGVALAERLAICGLGPVLLRGRRSPSPGSPPAAATGIVTDSWSTPLVEVLPALVMVAVPDQAITATAIQLSRCRLAADAVVLHTSGLQPAEALAPCRSSGAQVASWHPLQSFPPPTLVAAPTRWQGVPCAIEGDTAAVAKAIAVARRLGLAPWQIDPADKAVYHAAAAVASNLTHVLVAAAAAMMDRCGLPRAATREHPLQPLVEASVTSALAAPGLEGLTGAIARADRATVDRHIAVLDDELAAVYDALAKFVGRSRASTWLD